MLLIDAWLVGCLWSFVVVVCCVGVWCLVVGRCWLLCWLLLAVRWLMVVGCWVLVVACWSLVVGCPFFGCVFFVGGGLLVVG